MNDSLKISLINTEAYSMQLFVWLVILLYFRAVYCILGACDVTDEHSEVAKTADDYLWFKLCQIREGERTDSRSGENITLQHLQTLISQDYGTVNQILLLFGMFFGRKCYFTMS